MRRWIAACALGLILGAGIGPAHAKDPDKLWTIVHDRCVPDQLMNNDPSPCAAVDLAGGEARGHVILKDIKGTSQFLLIPTTKIKGIEDPKATAADAPNYFADAWAARFQVSAALHLADPLKDDKIGLAINSAVNRGQNQLHIHIDCLAPGVIEALRAHMSTIGETWSDFPEPLPPPVKGWHKPAPQLYQARRVDGAVLAANPFRLLAEEAAGAAADMGDETLVVAKTTLPDGHSGFVLLANHAARTLRGSGHGEDLLDHSCAIAKQAP